MGKTWGNIKDTRTISRMVTLEDVLQLKNDFQRSFIAQFDGVRVMIDTQLKGNQFYCMVSKAVYKQILKESEYSKNK